MEAVRSLFYFCMKGMMIYENLFKSHKKIILKTDNLTLLSSSIINLNSYDYKITDINFDLTNSDIPNIKTEYETKFIKEATKINYLVAEKD